MALQQALLPLLNDFLIPCLGLQSPTGMQDSCRGNSCFEKHVARETASQLLPEQCSLAQLGLWGRGWQPPGLENFVSSPHSFPQGSPLKTWWVRRGPERRQGLFPRESLGSGRNQEGSELPASEAGVLPWFCFPFHKYEHQRAGEGIFWSQQQNEENISLNLTLLQPSTCSTSEKKKVLCTEGKGGKRFYFPSQ